MTPTPPSPTPTPLPTCRPGLRVALPRCPPGVPGHLQAGPAAGARGGPPSSSSGPEAGALLLTGGQRTSQSGAFRSPSLCSSLLLPGDVTASRVESSQDSFPAPNSQCPCAGRVTLTNGTQIPSPACFTPFRGFLRPSGWEPTRMSSQPDRESSGPPTAPLPPRWLWVRPRARPPAAEGLCTLLLPLLATLTPPSYHASDLSPGHSSGRIPQLLSPRPQIRTPLPCLLPAVHTVLKKNVLGDLEFYLYLVIV